MITGGQRRGVGAVLLVLATFFGSFVVWYLARWAVLGLSRVYSATLMATTTATLAAKFC